MCDQLDSGDAEGSLPIREGSRKLNIKMSFRTLSSPRKADKGRLQHNGMALAATFRFFSGAAAVFLSPTMLGASVDVKIFGE
jgi:hypothetical protein